MNDAEPVKPCPKCNEIISEDCVACPKCHALLEDDTTIVPAKQTKSFDGPGIGRKLCPGCDKYVAAATRTCSCGHSFQGNRNPHPQAMPLEDDAPRSYKEPSRYGMQTVGIPAGACPCKLNDLSPEGILEWADRIREHFLAKHQSIRNEGIVYFGRTLYDFQSDEFKLIKATIMGV